VGRTVRTHLANCPPGWRGPSARLVGKRCSTRRSGANNGPSARVPRTVRTCRVLVGPRTRGDKPVALLLLPKPQELLLSLSFLLSLKENTPTLELLIQALPGPSEPIPGLSARFSTMSSGYFFQISHSLSLSRILRKKVIRVWWCDLNFVHGFKFLAW
jgi:hypothetical protein